MVSCLCLVVFQDKIDRARIKVEHIIREDYSVEGMEIVEMYCDLLLARFGLVQSMKYTHIIHMYSLYLIYDISFYL